VSALPPICILAGGLGTRLGKRSRETPKALVEVAGEPFLWHQLRLLAAHGASEVVLCVGHLGDLIERSVGDRRFGLRIAYSHDAPGLDGTLGAIRRARGLLGERFLVLYGDTYLRLDYAGAVAAWRESGLPAMMTVLRNEGRWELSNADYADGRVLAYDKRMPRAHMRWIDYGLVGLRQTALSLAPQGATDLSDLLRKLAREGLLCGVEATERFYEIGTPAALAETDAFLRERLAPSRPRARDGDAIDQRRCVPPERVPGGRTPSEHRWGRSAKRAAGVLSALQTELFARGLRFALTGITASVVYIATTTLLAVVVGLPFQVALVLSYGLTLAVHFTMQRYFVWAHQREQFALSLHRQLGWYLLVAGGQYGGTAVSALLLPPVLGLSPETVYLLVAPMLASINFLLYRNGIFHPRAPVGERSP
jgi:putative flippase GtrA/molybdopterin-guanine dinucleotide biosynthesis protein A